MNDTERRKQILIYLGMTDTPRIVMGEDILPMGDIQSMLGVVPVNLILTRSGLEAYKHKTDRAINADCLLSGQWRKGQVVAQDEMDKEGIVKWVTKQLQNPT